MPFVPMGGFPPLVILEDEPVPEKTLETRGLPSTNIVSIGNIINVKKKESLFSAFGSEEEESGEILLNDAFDYTPYEYDGIGS